MVKLVNQAIKNGGPGLPGYSIYICIYIYTYIFTYIHHVSLSRYLFCIDERSQPCSLVFPQANPGVVCCQMLGHGTRSYQIHYNVKRFPPFQGEGPAVSSILSSKYCTNLHFGCWPGAHKNFLQNWSQDGHPFCCFWNRQEFPIWETPGRLPNTFGVGGNWTPKNLPKKDILSRYSED